MVDVQVCSWLRFSAFKEFPALLAEYADESSIAGLPAACHHEASYLALERAGVMHILCAILDGELIGFVIVLVNVNPHYSVKLAVVESIFVAGKHRKSGAGLLLRKHAEQIAKEQGAVGFLLSAPAGSRFAKVMERDKAYRETNRVFFRSLV